MYDATAIVVVVASAATIVVIDIDADAVAVVRTIFSLTVACGCRLVMRQRGLFNNIMCKGSN